MRAWHKKEKGKGEVLFISLEHDFVKCRMVSSKYNKVPFYLTDRMSNWELKEVKDANIPA